MGPSNNEVYHDTGYSRHKGSRSFTFYPTEPGEYKLYINSGARISFVEYAKVKIYVNDRRILTRIFGWFNF